MTDEHENDVELEHEDAPENQAHEKFLEKIEKLKTELSTCKSERQEYLDGWQRTRADMANSKRERVAAFERMQSAIKEEIVIDFIPILDSFDSAMQEDSWRAVDESWRKGVDYIRSQCESALDKHGIKSFGNVGDVFDSTLHEAIQEVEDKTAEPHTILRVMRKGYRTNDRIIRPAQVIIVRAS